MKTKLRMTREGLISLKTIIYEKLFGIVFYIRVRIQKYEKPILCYTET